MTLETLHERGMKYVQIKTDMAMESNEGITTEEIFVARIDCSAHSCGEMLMQRGCWVTRKDEEHAKVSGKVTGFQQRVVCLCQMRVCVFPEMLQNCRSPHHACQLSWPSPTADVDRHRIMYYVAPYFVDWVLNTLPPFQLKGFFPSQKQNFRIITTF
jgi:hypothetical protein